jgi:hypothetical protein
MKQDDIYHDIDSTGNRDVDFHERENLYRKMLRIDNNHFHHHRIILEHRLRLISRRRKNK